MRAVVGADALDISASKLVIVSDGHAFAILRQSQRANAGELRLVLRGGARCGSHNVFAPTQHLRVGWRWAERDGRVLPALNGKSLSLFRHRRAIARPFRREQPISAAGLEPGAQHAVGRSWSSTAMQATPLTPCSFPLRTLAAGDLSQAI